MPNVPSVANITLVIAGFLLLIALVQPVAERLRHDFNRSLEKLQQEMTAVGSNAQAIRSGAQEIATGGLGHKGRG